MAKKARKTRKAKTTAAATSTAVALTQGEQNAKDFFDTVEDDKDGAGLRAAIEVYQDDIIALATKFGFVFSYDDMQKDLNTRFDVKKPTKHKYCCT